jgi:hypothetical protein
MPRRGAAAAATFAKASLLAAEDGLCDDGLQDRG